MRPRPALRAAIVALAAVLALGGARAAAEARVEASDQSQIDDVPPSSRGTSRPIVRAAHRPRSAPSTARQLDVVLPQLVELLVVAPRLAIVTHAPRLVAIAPVTRSLDRARAPPRG